MLWFIHQTYWFWSFIVPN